jgi:uncharacterized membrane-anchored protein YhcB (DUF1043 family)
LPKSCQNVVKKLSKSYQKVANKLAKSCQKLVIILKRVGEEGGGEEEGDL